MSFASTIGVLEATFPDTSMHSVDWNWFFSSLAQSTAAIVGILGAFIITKVLSNQALFVQKKARLAELLAESRRIAADADDHAFGWYNMRMNEEALERLENDLSVEKTELPEPLQNIAEIDDFSKHAEDYYLLLNFSEYVPAVKVLESIKGILTGKQEAIHAEDEAFRQRAEAHRTAQKQRLATPLWGHRLMGLPTTDQQGYFEARSARQKQLRIPPARLIEKLQDENRHIKHTLRAAVHQMRLNKEFLTGIAGDPESSPQITLTLLLVFLLFCAGVVYPLSFTSTPLEDGIHLSFGAFLLILFSLKGALLAIVLAIFSVILGIFYRINHGLRYSKDDRASLDSWTELRTFSEYFAVAADNQKFVDALERQRKETAP